MDAILKKNKNLIITAVTVNNIGDTIFDLFIAWGLSVETGNFMNAVYVIGTSIAFRAVLSFFMGAFTDKHPKKKLMIASHLSSIIVITVFGFMWRWAQQIVGIGIIFVLMNDINNEMFTRSYISMTADFFNEEGYIKFQSISNIIVRIASIFGAALAGVLIDNLPYYIIFLINILTYIGSLSCVLSIVYAENRKFCDKKQVTQTLLKSITDDIKYTLKSIISSSYLRMFIILMFILNLAYGYIPQVLPIFKADLLKSATLLGLIKSALTIGEIVGLAIVNKYSKYISLTFKISMLANMIILLLITLINNSTVVLISFLLYGLFDSLTQPLFGYTVSRLDRDNRGKLLGGIDAIIMFSPSIGIYVISALSSFNELISGICISFIFLTGYLIIRLNKNLNHIKLK